MWDRKGGADILTQRGLFRIGFAALESAMGASLLADGCVMRCVAGPPPGVRGGGGEFNGQGVTISV